MAEQSETTAVPDVKHGDIPAPGEVPVESGREERGRRETKRASYEANVSFYRVRECGYYDRETGQHQFCDLASTLDQMHQWVNRPKLKLGNTCTFPIVAEREQLGVYCLGMTSDKPTGDWLLALWNAIETTDEQVASIAGDSAMGAPKVDLHRPPDGHIPGYATYFWFLPKVGAVATIRLKHLSTSPSGMAHYITGFLRSLSRHAVTETDDGGEIRVLGYRENPELPVNRHLPRFRPRLWERKESFDAIRERRQSISKVIRKAELDRTVDVQGDFLNSLFRLLGMTKPNPARRTKVKLRSELAIKPSEQELGQILSEWEKGLETDWADIGFQFAGNAKMVWLSHAYIKQPLALDLLWKNAELADESSLLSELMRFRSSLLPLLSGGQST